MSPEAQADQNSQPAQTQVLRGGAGNVDKIRDILFGSQMRDYETRFARLEETLVKETLEIRESNRRRFEQLESFIKRELESLQARLKSERDERLDGVSQQSRELKDMGDTLSRRLRDLDDRESASERTLRNDLLEQARTLGDEIRARHDEMASILDKRVHELRDGKTDRAALASLFNEVALRLSDQFQIPGSEE
jgi:CHASE3 domain sensor protein